MVVGLNRWGELFRGHEVTVVVDNMQVLYMLRTGRSVNSKCMTWLRDLFWTCVNLDIDVNPIYIRSEDNVIADTLSRVLYRKTAMNLGDLLNGHDLCCKSELLSFYREKPGFASSPVYMEE